MVDHYPDDTAFFFLFGGISMFIGYFSIGMIAAHEIKIHFLVVSLFYFIIGIGTSASYHCGLATNYRNWPPTLRSLAVGFTVSFFGLSAFIFSMGGKYFFVKNHQLVVSDFLLFLGTTCLALNMFAVFNLKSIRPLLLVTETASDETQALLSEAGQNDQLDHNFHEYTEQREEREYIRSSHREISPNSYLSDSFGHSELGVELHLMEPGIVLQPISCFSSFDAYLLGFNMFAIVGIGLMYINNVGAIILALLPKESTPGDSDVQSLQQFHVALLSLGSFFSRIITGILTDMTFRIGVTKFFWIFLSAVLLAAGILGGFYVQNVDELFYITLLVAVSYGVVWTSVPILVGELFGASSFSNHWGWMTAVPAFGGQLFGLVFGYFFEQNANGFCKGAICFHNSFLFAFAFCSVCILGNILLFFRRRSCHLIE
jgi:hypothetical protein